MEFKFNIVLGGSLGEAPMEKERGRMNEFHHVIRSLPERPGTRFTTEGGGGAQAQGKRRTPSPAPRKGEEEGASVSALPPT